MLGRENISYTIVHSPPSWILYLLPVFYSFGLQARIPDLFCSLQKERKCVFQKPGMTQALTAVAIKQEVKKSLWVWPPQSPSSEYFL